MSPKQRLETYERRIGFLTKQLEDPHTHIPEQQLPSHIGLLERFQADLFKMEVQLGLRPLETDTLAGEMALGHSVEFMPVGQFDMDAPELPIALAA